MYESRNYMVFTEWGLVVEMIGDATTIMETDKFLLKLDKEIENEYGVLYNKVRKTFTLLHNIEFDVILPPHDQEMLDNGENSPLVEKLFDYTVRTQYKKEKENKKAVFEAKIKYLNYLKDFNDIETSDLELYINYLDNKQKTTKDKEEKEIIEIRLSLISEVIGRINQEVMKLAYETKDTISDVYNYVRELMTAANKLSYENRKAIMNLLIKVVDQCEQANNKQKNITNLMRKLDGIKEEIEKYSMEEKTSLENDLKSVVDELNVYNDEKTKEM